MNRIILDVIDSTNLFAKRISEKINKNIVIIANKQLNGYGTNNRDWFSNSDSIICSFVIFPKENYSINTNYSYDIAYAISNIINNICNINTYIKYPNDIYLNSKKVGGILIEVEYLENKIQNIIIGVGLNINQTNFPNELENIATSLFIESEIFYDKDFILNEIIKGIEGMI